MQFIKCEEISMRCFIAAELDKHIKQKLTDAQNLFRNLDGKFSWTKREQMHLTIKFLGSVPDSKIDELKRTISIALDNASIKPFEFSVNGLGSFPPARSPKILWVGVEQKSELLRLYDAIENELNSIGFPREQRKFTPHLTIARIKSKINTNACLKIIENNANFSAGNQRIEHITLFSSELTPSGAIYNIIERFNLSR